jgi:hypothetical protein
MDGELGGEKEARLERGLRDAAQGGLGEGGAGLSRARPLALEGKETCLPAIGSRVEAGGGCSWAPYPSSPKTDSKREVVPLGCAHVNK